MKVYYLFNLNLFKKCKKSFDLSSEFCLYRRFYGFKSSNFFSSNVNFVKNGATNYNSFSCFIDTIIFEENIINKKFLKEILFINL